MGWVVYADKPFPTYKWVFKDGFFPRKFAYKRDAERLAQTVKELGAVNVRVERQKKS